MKSAGNTILITGGASGIGHGLALRFHEAGNKVIIAGRRKELLEQITSAQPGIQAIVLDITDPLSVAQAAETTAASYPELNVLINNAGIMLPENVLDPEAATTAEDIIATNLLGTTQMTYAFLPQLMDKPNAAVINVSSALAFVPLAITPTYSATKAAVHAFTEALRVQLAGSPVQVIELIPPAVRTTLMGQQNDEHAMPLDAFLTETMSLLRTQPEANEIVVGMAAYLRSAEAEGRYDAALEMLSRA